MSETWTDKQVGGGIDDGLEGEGQNNKIRGMTVIDKHLSVSSTLTSTLLEYWVTKTGHLSVYCKQGYTVYCIYVYTVNINLLVPSTHRITF